MTRFRRATACPSQPSNRHPVRRAITSILTIWLLAGAPLPAVAQVAVPAPARARAPVPASAPEQSQVPVALAQVSEPTSAPYFEAAAIDPAIPTLEQIVGHRSGEQMTRPEDAVRYLRALADAAPSRLRVVEYARSWQGRPLVYAIIASPERFAQLDALKSGMNALSDPRRTSEVAAEALIADLPGTAWLSYGVHGNEVSSTDAGLAVAYHLLAAAQDPRVAAILADTVVFVDPVQNPDGRNRFIEANLAATGLAPSGSRIAAERNEPWPNGRTNHYLFDMNRDWIVQSQPEVRGRTNSLKAWRPLVVVDAHEMGTDASYYFAPEAEPINPFVTEAQMAMADVFGRNNAAAFDANGFDYFTRDVYDKLFPGYGDSWPAFYGAIAMTFEQGSPRGMLARRSTGEVFTYADAVRHHAVASLATLETTAANRERLLRNYWTYQQTGLQEGANAPTRAYVFAGGEAAPAGNRLASLLMDQGLDVRRAADTFTACGKSWPRGTYVVPTAQPRSRFVRTLLDPTSPMKTSFIAEQERRRARGLDDEIYDVTAWSPALAFNVDTAPCDTDPGAPAPDAFPILTTPAAPDGTIAGPREAVAYVVPWGSADAIRFLAGALREGLSVRSADHAFDAAGRTFPSGSLVFLAADHAKSPAHLRARLLQHAEQNHVIVQALASSYVEAGDNFGSRHVKPLIAPRIALAWDEPTSPTAAGATRFVIERQLGYPVTPVRVADLSDKGLAEFDVLILPDAYGSYTDRLGGNGVRALKDWTSRGGVLIAIGGAARFVADPASDLSAVRRERATPAKDTTERATDEAVVDGTDIADAQAARDAIRPDAPGPTPTSGVFARADVNAEHWMAAGAPERINVLVSGGDIYRPLTLDEGVNVVQYADKSELLAGGYLWAETAAQLAYKPYLTAEPVGDGILITFLQDPTFRAQLGGLDVFVANAIFRGPAQTRKLR